MTDFQVAKRVFFFSSSFRKFLIRFFLVEIAVGAPHERDSSIRDNTGCIYIYKGGVNGVSTKHVQRIRSEDVGKGIKGFGVSISKGLDIDGNNYNGKYSTKNISAL